MSKFQLNEFEVTRLKNLADDITARMVTLASFYLKTDDELTCEFEMTKVFENAAEISKTLAKVKTQQLDLFSSADSPLKFANARKRKL